MAFQSLQHLLGTLENQESWRSHRQYQQIVACWFDVVGAVVAKQTRPLGIQRYVLTVATSSSVWAQNLTFERQRILEKLNTRLNVGLVDIRFSTAQWHQNSDLSAAQDSAQEQWQSHPSWVAMPTGQEMPTSLDKIDPKAAFQKWAKVMNQRSQHLPLCPRCQCPTPEGELKRWSICALCAAKQW